MTLPNHRIGDKGQRWQVEAVDYPDEGMNVIGWSQKPETAVRMAQSILLAPGCIGAWVKDRTAGTSYAVTEKTDAGKFANDAR